MGWPPSANTAWLGPVARLFLRPFDGRSERGVVPSRPTQPPEALLAELDGIVTEIVKTEGELLFGYLVASDLAALQADHDRAWLRLGEWKRRARPHLTP